MMDKTDRELLVDVHGMVERIDERTEGLPERVTALEIQVEGHKRDVSLLKKMGIGIFTAATAAVGLVVKVTTGGS